MKIGAQDKKKVIAMAVLLVIAVPLVIHSYSSLNSEASAPANVPPAQPAAGPAATRIVHQKPGVPKVREGTLDPTLNTNILAASQKIEYRGSQRNIFKMFEPPVKIEQPITTVKTPPPPPTYTPPPPPQIPLKFYGFSNKPGEPKKAFLQNGPDIFVAVEGDIVDRRYKILKITNNSVLVEDVLNNHQQLISLTSPQSS